MNDNAKLLVEALRSGQYEQGRGALRRAGKYCCLGVACDLYAKQTGDGRWEEMHTGSLEDLYRFTGSFGSDFTGQLPEPIREWLGFISSLGTFRTASYDDDPDLDDKRSLASANDAGVSFDGIATLIETEPGLFA